MFIVPISTDAPAYHFPWGTISLITASVIAFLAVSVGGLAAEPYVLIYGDGLHPVQWLTSLFIHDGVLHLAGNMFFLWGFGLVVEGKLGWRKFVPVFLGLGIVESALEQLCLQNAQGSSLGASAAIMGLMAIAVVWAPRNDIIFAYGALVFGIARVGTVGVSILTFALLLTGCELLSIWWLDVHAHAAVLHLLGGLLGLGMGVALLKQGQVDCEGWDLFSLYSGSDRDTFESSQGANVATGAGLTRRRHHGVIRDRRQQGFARQSSTSPRRLRPTRAIVRRLIEQGKPRAALREWHKLQHLRPDSQLDQWELSRLAEGLAEIGMWQEAVALMQESIARFREDVDSMRVEAAAILLHKLGRPKAALRMIEPINWDEVSPGLQWRCEQLRAAAAALIDSGVIELREDPLQATVVPEGAGVGVESRA